MDADELRLALHLAEKADIQRLLVNGTWLKQVWHGSGHTVKGNIAGLLAVYRGCEPVWSLDPGDGALAWDVLTPDGDTVPIPHWAQERLGLNAAEAEVLFGIDGTIGDLRYCVASLLEFHDTEGWL